MRIGFDAKRLFLNSSGLGNYSRTLVKALAEANPNDDHVLYTPRIATNDRTRDFVDGNFEINTPGQIPSFMRSWWRSVHLGNVIKDHGLDVYHGLSNELPKSIDKGNCKSVVTIHDLIFLRYPEYYPRFDRGTYKRKVAHALAASDAVVAISERTKKDILEFFGTDEQKIHVIYQGCDPAFYSDQDKGSINAVKQKYGLDRPYVICVGTIEHRKNQLELVKAFIQSSFAESHNLILVGKARKYAGKISEFLNGSGFEARVKQLAQVSFSDLPSLLQGADASVYPSLYEGFGLPVLESLASGVPVIAKSGSCLEETGGEAALYYEKEAELVERLNSVLSDNDLRHKMISKGKEHALKFDNHVMASNYRSLYESLTS